MNCAIHTLRWLAEEGDPDTATGIPAAITIYDGTALCKACLLDILRQAADIINDSDRPPSYASEQHIRLGTRHGDESIAT